MSNTPNTPTKKYRPVLSGCSIDHIVALCKRETPISSESIEVLGVLAPFQAKIGANAIAEAYSTTPKLSLAEKLGLGIANPASTKVLAIPTVSKEEYWAQCYKVWADDPAKLSLSEIQAAQEHMYINDLMSAEELIAFESEK